MQLSQIPVQTPTPFYYYNLELLKKTVQAAKSESAPYGYRVHYAVKANANPVLLRLISQQGLGADCVSGNEIRQALECGFPADTIVYAGVGKSDAEIELALQHDIFCFNCESLPEIQVIDGIAARLGKKSPDRPSHQSQCRCPYPSLYHHRYRRKQIRYLFVRSGTCHHRSSEIKTDRTHRSAFSHRFSNHRHDRFPGIMYPGQ